MAKLKVITLNEEEYEYEVKRNTKGVSGKCKAMNSMVIRLESYLPTKHLSETDWFERTFPKKTILSYIDSEGNSQTINTEELYGKNTFFPMNSHANTFDLYDFLNRKYNSRYITVTTVPFCDNGKYRGLYRPSMGFYMKDLTMTSKAYFSAFKTDRNPSLDLSLLENGTSS